ncbi:unnamed protein product [Allacma fusca]|uniref:Uncharacterized protein n=1 Tax=Allacma fusca TaxID=39272 RepID=A0A8J2P2K7_9HEXA|nr:unnamed protein product [Allacma fusca]
MKHLEELQSWPIRKELCSGTPAQEPPQCNKICDSTPDKTNSCRIIFSSIQAKQKPGRACGWNFPFTDK